jgi:hypothetical protein
MSPTIARSTKKMPLKLLGVALIALIIGIAIGTGYSMTLFTSQTITETLVYTKSYTTYQNVEEYIIVTETMTASQWIPQSTSMQTAGQAGWKTIKTFTGSSYKDTEDFTVPTDYWRIVYTIRAESEEYAAFSAYIYPSGETAIYVTSVSFDKSGTDASYIREGPGDFWIKVLAANLRSWTIEVQIQQ